MAGGPGHAAGRFPWRRLVVTLLAPVVLLAGSQVTLPGVNDIELAHVTRSSVDASVFALGLVPLFSAFVLVELVALAVPRLRWRRHDPLGRVRLGQAVAALAIVVALIQGYFIAHYYEAMARGGAEVVMSPGMRFHLLMMVTLVSGTLVLAIVAGMIREHGLGNGYGALLLAGTAIEVGRQLLERGTLIDAATVGWVAVAIAIVAATVVLLRWRVDGMRLPTSGLSPLGDAPAVAAMFGILAMLVASRSIHDIQRWVAARSVDPWFVFPIVAIAVPIWAWLFARPAVVERVALQAGVPRPTLAGWRRATLVSGVGLLAIGGFGRLLAATDLARAASPFVLAIGTAVVLDLIDDARAHRTRVEPVAVLHQIQRAGLIEALLAKAGIPCHVHAGNLRALLAFFGPWAPAIVLVEAARAAEARGLIDQATRPPAGDVPVARQLPRA